MLTEYIDLYGLYLCMLDFFPFGAVWMNHLLFYISRQSLRGHAHYFSLKDD